MNIDRSATSTTAAVMVVGGEDEVKQIKQKLLASCNLPDPGSETNPDNYETNLSKFLTGKQSRQEFETACLSLLPKPQVGLHNHLLLTLLKRAHELNSSEKESLHKLKKRKLTASKNAAAAASASAAAAAAALEEQEEVETGKNKARIRRRMLKRYILSLPKSDRDRIKINLKQKRVSSGVGGVSQGVGGGSINIPSVTGQKSELVKSEESLVVPILGLNPATRLFPSNGFENKDDFQITQCQENLQLPSLVNLRERMSCIAKEQALPAGVTLEAIQLMSAAVEIHLKSVLELCLSRLRPYRQVQHKPLPLTYLTLSAGAASIGGVSTMTGGAVGGGGEIQDKLKPITITLEHLRLVLAEVAPHTVVEQPVCLEKLYLNAPKSRIKQPQEESLRKPINEEEEIEDMLAEILGIP